jgi:hypothetical protein
VLALIVLYVNGCEEVNKITGDAYYFFEKNGVAYYTTPSVTSILPAYFMKQRE